MWFAFAIGAVFIVAIVVTILFFTGNLPNTDPWVKKQIDVDSLSLDDLSSSCPKMEKIREKFGDLAKTKKFDQLFSESERLKLESIYRACKDFKIIESTVDTLSLDDLDESCRKFKQLRANYDESLFSERARRRFGDIGSACDGKIIEQIDVDSLSLDDLSSSCPKMEKITEKFGEPSKYMQLFSDFERRKLVSIYRGCQAVKNIESTVDSFSLDNLDESCRKIGELRARYGEPSTNTQLFSESVRRKLESITSACVQKKSA